MTRFLFTQESQLIVRLSYSRWGNRKSTATPIFISTAESVPAGIAAPVPVGSAPAPSHKKPERQRPCRACGTTLRGLNAQVVICQFAMFQHRVDMLQTGLWTIAHGNGHGAI